MVKRAANNADKDLGVINSEAGISLISDDRSDSTMAHEAGHFLGSLSESESSAAVRATMEPTPAC
jgi:hypothetical protein